MIEDFNVLELAIFEWLKRTYADPLLTAHIESARFLNRAWTQVGCYVHFEVSKELAPINLIDFEGRWPINGPDLVSKDIEHGGGTVLWGESGFINCIEMYAHGNFFNETVNQFELLPNHLSPNFR